MTAIGESRIRGADDAAAGGTNEPLPPIPKIVFLEALQQLLQAAPGIVLQAVYRNLRSRSACPRLQLQNDVVERDSLVNQQREEMKQ